MFRNNRGKYEDDTKGFQKFTEALRPRERTSENGEENREVQSTQSVSSVVSSPTPDVTSVVVSPARPANQPGPTPPESCGGVVSAGSVWQGSLKIDDSVRIDGRLSGEIEARHTVYVAEGAEVDAKIRAVYVIIAGKFQGEVHCTERFEVKPTGQAKCEVTTKTLVVHEGAFVEGQVHMTTESPFTAESGPRVTRANNGSSNEKRDVVASANPSASAK